ncbi:MULTISPECIES: DUF4288 domain-containing protein [Bacillus]|uniref:DUF4288 domain-containing protein n=1 Tax=Bacillus TaxID=1386 RepID=UPI00342FF30C
MIWISLIVLAYFIILVPIQYNYIKILKTKQEKMNGEQVTWKFRKVLHVFELNDTSFETGTELYARFLHVKKTETVDTVVKKYYPEYE